MCLAKFAESLRVMLLIKVILNTSDVPRTVMGYFT